VAVRWNTVSWAACSAMIGMACSADEPVPMMPTRRPVKSTPSWGHRPVWYVGPSKSSLPGMSGVLADDRHPVAITTNRQVTSWPRSVCTRHVAVASS
jgi:hypothetical protein